MSKDFIYTLECYKCHTVYTATLDELDWDRVYEERQYTMYPVCKDCRIKTNT